MTLAIILQMISACFYYATASFDMTGVMVLGLAINYAPLLLLMRHRSIGSEIESIQHFNTYRWVFTVSLFALGFIIDLNDDSVTMSGIQELANDAEVLFSGILLGMLWRNELFRLENWLINRHQK
jgi:hypothetical protein